MLKRAIAITIACSMLILFAGCSGPGQLYHEETALDKNWGRSVETAKYNQLLDPEAGKDLRIVEGLSGGAAGYSVNKYENSFKEKVKQESMTTTTK